MRLVRLACLLTLSGPPALDPAWQRPAASRHAAQSGRVDRLLVVSPEEMRFYFSSGSNLIFVTVLDDARRPVPWVPVDFESADPAQITFPYRRAWTNADGLAATVVTSPLYPRAIRTSFTVRSGNVCAGPFRVRAKWAFADGPYGFEAPPLEPFTSLRQLLVGEIYLFSEPISVGSTIGAWSIDPTVAEPLTVVVGSPTSEATQFLELDVIARRQGETTFIVNGTLYDAVVRGTVPCLAGACEPATRGFCDENGGCLQTVGDTPAAVAPRCTRLRGLRRQRECRRLCSVAIAQCTVATGGRRRACRRQYKFQCRRLGPGTCLPPVVGVTLTTAD